MKQEYLDYPCRLCRRLNYFINTVDGRKRWVCTECQVTIGDDEMSRWQGIRGGLVDKGIVLRIGMSLMLRRPENE